VRIFAVAEFLLAAKSEVQGARAVLVFSVSINVIGGGGEALKFGGDHAVIA